MRDNDPLYPVLTALTGRRLTNAEIWQAMGVSRPRYYELRAAGELMRPDRLIILAHHLDINPIELLVKCVPEITVKDAIEFVARRRALAMEFADADETD